MKLRSMLFVPGDSERKFAKAAACGADALILDLEDAVVPSRKAEARRSVQGFLDDPAPRRWAFIVRINPLDTGLADADLAAVVRPGLAGILLPKANGGDDVTILAEKLDRCEAEAGMTPGSVRALVVATETARAMFNLGSYAPAHARLAGLTWGAEDLAAVLGASANKEEDGSWTRPYALARTLCLYAAAAAEVAAIDTIFTDFRNPAGLEEDCRASRRDGFVGRLAIHPDQVGIINAAYTPSTAEVDHARRIVEAFAAHPQSGTLGIDGKMYDLPHLKAARNILAAADHGTAEQSIP